jgi:DNA-binding PadR family transcriptional regulator
MTSSKVTDLDYSILGLVKQNPLSGYRIRMIFETTALGNFSSSPGTIYPALKRLVKIGLIEKKVQSKTKSQEIFYITKKGVSALTKWILKPIVKNDITKRIEMILLRIAFMDTLNIKTKERKLKFLESFQVSVQNYIVELKDYYSKESSNMPMSGRLAFEHGIESYQLTLKWVQKIISIYDRKD